MSKVLMKGNEALAEAAIRAGCRYFFGYPITPQNEIPEYLARRLPEHGGVFLQAESEVAAINMVYGAAAAGARVLTSSSGPGISLKQEGISFLAATELPCVIVNMMRGGPGLGGIQAAQGDYFQATKGGGHGDYRLIVLAPNSVQELVDLTLLAFDLADHYRNPAMILGDGILGQMMEPVILPPPVNIQVDKPWAATGCKGRNRNIVNSLYLDPQELAELNDRLQEKYNRIKANEQRYDNYLTTDAELVVVAFGTAARIARQVVDDCRLRGMKVGLFRPVTLWPYPEKGLIEATRQAKRILTLELNTGQMVEDVRLSLRDRIPVDFLGCTGGILPKAKDVYNKIESLIAQKTLFACG